MSEAKILVGDVRDSLRQLADGSVRCVVTSPPYWGLRDYGNDGQIGLEQTPELYVAEMVEVFREVRRVLADDGTLWLNLGDSYNGAAPNRSGANGYNDGRTNRDKRFSVGGVQGLKPKDLVGIPWRVAFGLQADGWYLRQDIIWAKPNPMPESVTDRCTKAHEYVFLLTKQPRYYYDHKAAAEPAKYAGVTVKASDPNTAKNGAKGTFGATAVGFTQHDTVVGDTRNRRSVWTVTTKPFKGAHFAVMPEALVEPCVLAGSARGDTVLDPFSGSGTVGVVALKHDRNYIGCELNPEYADLSRKRICDDQPLMNTVEVVR
jgi:DNA modification methylase